MGSSTSRLSAEESDAASAEPESYEENDPIAFRYGFNPPSQTVHSRDPPLDIDDDVVMHHLGSSLSRFHGTMPTPHSASASFPPRSIQTNFASSSHAVQGSTATSRAASRGRDGHGRVSPMATPHTDRALSQSNVHGSAHNQSRFAPMAVRTGPRKISQAVRDGLIGLRQDDSHPAQRQRQHLEHILSKAKSIHQSLQSHGGAWSNVELDRTKGDIDRLRKSVNDWGKYATHKDQNHNDSFAALRAQAQEAVDTAGLAFQGVRMHYSGPPTYNTGLFNSKSTCILVIIPLDHMSREKIIDRHPVVQIAYFIAIFGNVLCGSTLRACTATLQMSRHLITTTVAAVRGDTLIGHQIVDDIPLSIQTVFKDFNLDTPFTTYAGCSNPVCGALYAPSVVNPDGNTLWPLKCTKIVFPGNPECGDLLTETEPRSGRINPRRPVLMWPIEDTIASLLSRSDLEQHIDSFADQAVARANGQDSATWSSVIDGTFVKDFQRPDGSLFFKRQGTDTRILFALHCDGFRFERMLLRGPKDAHTLISIKCLSLPPKLQNSAEYVYPWMLFPDEPNDHTVIEALRPVVEKFKQGWTDGIYFSSTAMHPEGRLTYFAVGCVCADTKARAKIGGFQDIASGKCTMCKLRLAKAADVHGNYDWETWQAHNIEDLRKQAEQWRDAPSVGARKSLADKNGVRWSPLWELDYWDPRRQLTIDPMHEIENLAKHHSEMLGLTVPDKDLEKAEKQNAAMALIVLDTDFTSPEHILEKLAAPLTPEHDRDSDDEGDFQQDTDFQDDMTVDEDVEASLESLQSAATQSKEKIVVAQTALATYKKGRFKSLHVDRLNKSTFVTNALRVQKELRKGKLPSQTMDQFTTTLVTRLKGISLPALHFVFLDLKLSSSATTKESLAQALMNWVCALVSQLHCILIYPS